jgi:hypothetical protein
MNEDHDEGLAVTSRRKQTSEDLCWTIVRLGSVFDTADISKYTGKSERTVQRILRLHRLTGKPYSHLDRRFGGRRRWLNNDDVNVSIVYHA